MSIHPSTVVFGVLLMLVASRARAAEVDHFRVTDKLSPVETEEVTTLIVDGVTKASFRLDAQTPSLTIDVEVPSAPSHVYGLCGHLTFKADDGSPRRVGFDFTGELLDAPGHTFEAIAVDQFTRFGVVDITDPNHPISLRRLPDHACAPAVS